MQENWILRDENKAEWIAGTAERFALVPDDSKSDWQEFVEYLLVLGNVVFDLRDCIYIASIIFIVIRFA